MRILLDQRHMLIGRRVIHHGKLKLLEKRFNTVSVRNIGKNKFKADSWEFGSHFHLNVIERGFSLIQHHDKVGFQLGDLPHDFTADGTRTPGDEDRLSVMPLLQVFIFYTDRFAVQ